MELSVLLEYPFSQDIGYLVTDSELVLLCVWGGDKILRIYRESACILGLCSIWKVRHLVNVI